MAPAQNLKLTTCFSPIKLGGVKPLLYSLAFSTALVTSAFAQTLDTIITLDELNSFTNDKITIEESTIEDFKADETNKIVIGNKVFNFLHQSPDNLYTNHTGSNKDSYYNRYGGAILNESNGTYNDIIADFISNSAVNQIGYGGAIYNTGTINSITGDFIGNIAGALRGYGGAISNSGTINNITGNFIGNTAIGYYFGGASPAILNAGKLTLTNSNFYKNYTTTSNVDSAAINNSGSLNIIADNGTSIFSGNGLYKTIFTENPHNGGILANDNELTNYLNRLRNTTITNDGTNYFTTNQEASSTSWIERKIIKQEDGRYFVSVSHIDKRTGNIEDYLYASDYQKDGDNYTFNTDCGAYGIANSICSSIGKAIKQDDGSYYIYHSYNPNILGYTFESNALRLENYSAATLNSINNGLIQFDDKIHGSSGEQLINDLKSQGIQVSRDNNNNYIVNFGGDILTSHPTPFGDFVSMAESMIIPESEITSLKDQGLPLIEIPNIHGGYDYIMSQDILTAIISQQPDGNYAVEQGILFSDHGGSITITGDQSSKVVFNEEIVDVGSIDITGTNVFANKGIFARANVHDGAILNIGANTSVEDTSITSGGTINIAASAVANRVKVDEGGVLTVATGGEANDTTINYGGSLKALAQAKITNLLAEAGAKLDIDKSAIMTGNIIINADAHMGGTYDYSKIFKSEATEHGALTLVGGTNPALNDDSLVNTVANKKLNLTSGDYTIGSQNSSVKGWDKLTVADAKVKLAGNIEMANPSKSINIASDGILDLAGNSPLIATITGSLNNDGLLDFHHENDDADDITNVYGNYTAYTNARMNIDINPTLNTSDQLLVDGDVKGTTKVTLYTLTDGATVDLIKFVDAPNDDASTGAYFKIDRVYRQALDVADQWKIVHKDNTWFVTSAPTDTTGLTDGYGDPDAGDLDIDLADDAVLPPNFPNAPTIKPVNSSNNKLVSEALAYMALPTVGLEQVRDLTKVVTNKVVSTKYKCADCGVYDHMYNGRPLNNAWIDMSHRKADLEAPADVEAKINAVDLGFDVQSDPYNRLGVFASYRQGDYELSGEGQDYYSTEGSELDIDSWALGLYHRYDRRRLWTMSSIYGGLQNVNMATNDGISAETDGLMFGANIEAGMVFEPKRRLTLEPSIRLDYNFIKYDDMSDRYGKTAEYDNISNLEAELGVKIEKSWIFGRRGIAKLFVKPSVIQNMGKGDVSITSLDAVEGIDNQTLLRGEIGMSIAGDNGLSGFAIIGHTFGSDYKSTDFNAGLGYSW